MKKIIGLSKNEVRLDDYNPIWEKEFLKEKKLLKTYLNDHDVEIEHIGSTSIIGIKAKPIIDMLITVDKLDDARQFIPIFEKLEDYDFRDDNGVKGEYLLRKGPENNRTHYIHIVEKNSLRYKESIYFRDYLNTHFSMAKEYEEIKVKIVQSNELDRKAYTNKKRDFINKIMEKAIQLYDFQNIIYSYDELLKISKKYDVHLYDIILIYLNMIGINTSSVNTTRVRFELKFNDYPKLFKLGLYNNPNSVFIEEGNRIYFDKLEIGEINELENDDCSSSYFRNNNKSLTINSNQRSNCFGCLFCPNNLIVNNEEIILEDEESLTNYFKKIINNESMDDLEYITICTGCFENSVSLINHLLLIKAVSEKLGFNGVIHYIGSQLIDKEDLKKVKTKIDNLMISFTVECINNREQILHKIKRKVTIIDYKEAIKYCNSIGITTNYLFVLGLDPIDDIINFIIDFKDITKHFPTFNIYQIHSKKDMKILNEKAVDLEYYLILRKYIEKIYSDKKCRPQSWECYRPLWYTHFDNSIML